MRPSDCYYCQFSSWTGECDHSVGDDSVVKNAQDLDVNLGPELGGPAPVISTDSVQGDSDGNGIIRTVPDGPTGGFDAKPDAPKYERLEHQDGVAGPGRVYPDRELATLPEAPIATRDYYGSVDGLPRSYAAWSMDVKALGALLDSLGGQDVRSPTAATCQDGKAKQ